MVTRTRHVVTEVTRGVSLGWNMQALYLSPLARQAGNPNPDRHKLTALADWASLSEVERARVLVARIHIELADLPVADDLLPLASAVESEFNKACEPDRAAFNSAMQVLHVHLIIHLTAVGNPLGVGYRLGFAMAETALLPLRLDGDALGHKLAELFGEQRLSTVSGWLTDLKSSLPDHSSEATEYSLACWRDWVTGASLGAGVERLVSEDRDRVRRALRQQGDTWRALLTGEKSAVDVLSTGDYVQAAGATVKYIGDLARDFAFSAAGIALLAFVGIAVVSFVLVLGFRVTSAVTAAVVALLGALALTTASAGVAVQNALKPVRRPLWDSDLTAAVSRATVRLPSGE